MRIKLSDPVKSWGSTSAAASMLSSGAGLAFLQQQLGINPERWGVHTQNQSDAKALAVGVGAKKDVAPKVHNNGYYGHYHGPNGPDDRNTIFGMEIPSYIEV
ncbi:MAG: hypothetical protein FWD30_03140 [Dehalococcoidia bacterium]|nr:hypothetical protein [Dehalococcoidia bacterium]